MAQKQSGKSFRSFLGVQPSKPTPEDSVLVIVDAQNEYGTQDPMQNSPFPLFLNDHYEPDPQIV